MTSLQDRFAGQMGQLLGPDFPTDIALAVSGGGDSMAMLYLAHNWTREFGLNLWVVTIDHGLRPESAEEARMVAEECRTLGWPHATLRWHWDGKGNVMEAARDARLQLIDRWRQGIEHVLMAHTADDVAETFLMRLNRGSGVEGLSSMAASRYVTPHTASKSDIDPDDMDAVQKPPGPVRRVAGVPAFSRGYTVLRPLLDARRDELRHVLRTLHGPWVDDPGNENRVYNRVRMRQLLAQLEDEGLGVDTVAATAVRMSRSRDALVARATDVFDRTGQLHRSTGQVVLDRDQFAEIEGDTQLRILAQALQWVSGNPYRPRMSALEDLLDRAMSGGGGTLHGCEIRAGRTGLRIFREYSAVRDICVPVGDYWDDKIRFFAVNSEGFTTRALGDEGWQQVKEISSPAIPFHAARSLPAVFGESGLISCPGLGFGATFGCETLRPFSLFSAGRKR